MGGCDLNELPSLTKPQWPAHITDALGIPSIQGSAGPWHSTGDTIDRAWFQAICDYLGIDYPGERIRAMRTILETAGGAWKESRHSSAGEGKVAGGNVRKEAFEDLWIALHNSGRLTDHGPSESADMLLEKEAGEALPESRFSYRHIRLRQGQAAFRADLLRAYEGRCAVSDVDVVETLEAAHIAAHADGGRIVTSNGLLLRADLHTLFDLGLIAIDTAEWRVRVHPHVARSESWWRQWLANRPFRLPRDFRDRPDIAALDAHLTSAFSRSRAI